MVFNCVQLYSVESDTGVLCVPESWTDRNPLSSPAVPPINSPLNPWMLKELVKLLKFLDELPSSLENKH